MEHQEGIPTEPGIDAQSPSKRPYTPPMVSFVPLEAEERLLMIGYEIEICGGPTR